MVAKLKPPQIVAISFFAAIVVGTLLLSLPFSVKNGQHLSFVDTIFTATSATCVTGLIVKDTGSFFSPFGKAIIFMLIQIGGLGIMTFSTLFAIVLGRKLTLKHNIVIQRALNQQKVEGVKHLIKYILLIAFGVELMGALCLFLRWTHTKSWSTQETLFNAIFHSVSAFCNAGFSFFQTSFSEYLGDPYINTIMITLIFLGGIGFIVVLDLPKFFSFGNPVKQISVQTKMALTISFILIAVGALFIFFIERNNALSGFSLKERFFASLFQAVTARTAGFNTIDIKSFLPSTMLIIMLLMFIGASPGSTGGGIKTCTFGVLIAAMLSIIYNKEKVSIFKRTIPTEVIRRALIVVFLAILWIVLVTVILLLTEQRYLESSKEGFVKVLFEVISAFGTVGLSTGLTPHLSVIGKILVSITMFLGRVGPLTIALSIVSKKDKIIYSYPEERIMVG